MELVLLGAGFVFVVLVFYLIYQHSKRVQRDSFIQSYQFPNTISVKVS